MRRILGKVGWWSERVVPRHGRPEPLVAADHGAAPRGLRRAGRPGAGDRLRQRAERRGLPRRGHLGGRRGAVRPRLGARPRSAGPARPCRSSGSAWTGSGWPPRTRRTTPRCRRSRSARSPTPRPLWRRCAGCCGPAARCTCSSTVSRRTRGWPAWQRRLDGLQGRVAAGCHLTRDTPALLERTGFTVERLDQAYLPGPGVGKPWTFVLPGHCGASVSDDHSARALAAAEQLGLAHEVTRHGPVRSLEEAAAARGVEPHQLVKTMVVRVSEGEHVFVLVPGDREIAWPKLRALLGVNRLTMASRGHGVRRHRLRARHDHPAGQPDAAAGDRGRVAVGPDQPRRRRARRRADRGRRRAGRPRSDATVADVT